MILLEDVWVTLGTQEVLRGASMHARTGQITALVGESGSGKSTMLRLMMGFISAERGRVVIDGQNVAQATEREWADVRRKMGMVFQNSALFDSLTVSQNVGFYPHYVERQPWRTVQGRVLEVLSELDLEEHAGKLPGELSGGMQRRVALARSLIYHPKILLYDEPTTGLDPQMIAVVNELVLETNEKYGVTSVVVTHDLECVHEVADHVVLLSAGVTTTVGEAHQLLVSDDPAVFAFTANWRKSIQMYGQELAGTSGPADE